MSEPRAKGLQWEGPSHQDVQSRWYSARQGKTQGPLSYDELIEQARAGTLRRSDHVWRSGFEDWISVSARPDFLAPMPGRPEFGVVPESIEAAEGLHTDEVRWSLDVLDVRPGETPLAASSMADLPSTQDPRSEMEVKAMARLEEHMSDRGAVEIGPIPTSDPHAAALKLASGLMEADVDRGASREHEALIAGLVSEEHETQVVDLRSIQEGGDPTLTAHLRAWRWPLLGLAISILLALFALLALGGPLGRRTLSEGPTLPLDATQRFHEPTWAQTRTAPAPVAAKTDDQLGWLNRLPSGPRMETAKPKRAEPRPFRAYEQVKIPVLAQEDQGHRTPKALTHDLVGEAIGASVQRFGRCAAHDRLSDNLPSGAALRLRVSDGGEVNRVRVTGVRGPVARCMLRVAKALRFPPSETAETKILLTVGAAGTLRAQLP